MFRGHAIFICAGGHLATGGNVLTFLLIVHLNVQLHNELSS